MKSNYKKLGTYIREVDIRNDADIKENLLGVSTQKVFIPSIANTIGTDFTKYKVVKRNQFAYVPDTSRRGDKIGMALLQDCDTAIVSQAYTVFEIIDTKELLPEYLMMWFRRPEFDRYARYMSHGSVRELFGWDELCGVELPVPDITEQQNIVDEYNLLCNRIVLNEQMNQKLEETAQAIYKQWFVDFEFPDENGQPYKSSGGELEESKLGDIPKGWKIEKLGSISAIKGGKRLPKGENLTNIPTSHPYIKVADMNGGKFLVLNNSFEYVTDEIQKKICRYTVNTGDLIMSIVGTIGLVGVIHHSLNNANLTENCVKITNIASINTDYLYHYFCSQNGQNDIETKTVGGVQGKLPIYNIQAITLICPSSMILNQFYRLISKINLILAKNTSEIAILDTMRILLLSNMT